MANRQGNNGNSKKLYLGGFQNHCRWVYSHEIKRHLLLGRKTMTNLDSILKNREITLPTKVHLVKAMVFPVVTYGYESWTIKKAEHRRINAFELWCWRRLLRIPWTARRSNQSVLKEISPEYSLEGLLLKLKLQYLGHLMQKTDSLEKTLMLENIEGRRRRRQQSIRRLDGITDLMDMSLSKLGSWRWTGSLGCYSSWDHKGLNTTKRLNWADRHTQEKVRILWQSFNMSIWICYHHQFFFVFFLCVYLFFFFFKLYIIVLVLPNIKMNPPQVYMCSP